MYTHFGVLCRATRRLLRASADENSAPQPFRTLGTVDLVGACDIWTVVLSSQPHVLGRIMFAGAGVTVLC